MNLSSHEPPPLPQMFEEASGWFVQFRLGDVGAQEREAFNAWLCRSPDHIRAYLQIAQTYVDLPALQGKVPLDIDALIERARSEVNVTRINERSSPSFAHDSQGLPTSERQRGPVSALAAAAVLAALGVSAYFAVDAHRAPTYATSTGEQRSVALPDGSTVALNARSRVRIHLSARERRIDLLEGQALFYVAKDESRPFVVRSGDTVIRAVGTEFDVYRRDSGTTVTVIEGRVAITPGNDAAASEAPSVEMRGRRKRANSGGAVYVSAGQQLVLEPGSALQPQSAKPAAAIAWTQRRLVFDATSLPEAVSEFNRYTTRPLIIEGEELSRLRISGIYSTADPAALLRFLEVEFGLTAREDADQIVITRE